MGHLYKYLYLYNYAENTNCEKSKSKSENESNELLKIDLGNPKLLHSESSPFFVGMSNISASVFLYWNEILSNNSNF